MSTVFVGDVGTVLEIDCGVDVTTATVMQVKARGPKHNRKTFTATLEAPNSITYTLADGDFDYPGPWKLQAYVEMPVWQGYGEVVDLSVEDPV